MHYEAFKLFEEAAAKGQNFQAIYNLGEMYHYGLGASKSCTHAATVRILLDFVEGSDYGFFMCPPYTIFLSLYLSVLSSTTNMWLNAEIGTILYSLTRTMRTKLVMLSMPRSDICRQPSVVLKWASPTLRGSLTEVTFRGTIFLIDLQLFGVCLTSKYVCSAFRLFFYRTPYLALLDFADFTFPDGASGLG